MWGQVIAPFVSLILIDAVAMDMNAFTFRTWEAVASVRVLSGPFYPDVRIRMEEQGELAHHTEHAVPKWVEWHTDMYGFRNTPSDTIACELILVGDSNIVGSASSQSETLASQVQQEVGIKTYSYAPSIDFRTFLRDPLRLDLQPRVVVFSIIERYLGGPDPLPYLTDTLSSMSPTLVFRRQLERWPIWRRLAVHLDRSLKLSLLYYCRARIEGSQSHGVQSPVEPEQFFLEGRKALARSEAGDIDGIVDAVASYSGYLHNIGVRFIFMPIPNKETILSGQLGAPSPPELIPEVVKRLRQMGVEAIDLQGPFLRESGRGESLYHLDDAHWNSRGISIAKDQLALEILHQIR